MKSYAQIVGVLLLSLVFSLPGIAGIEQAEGRVVQPAYLSWRWRQQLSGGIIEDSSPTLYDLDSDGKLEIIIGTTNKRSVNENPDKGAQSVLAVLEDDGTVKWQVSVPDPIYSSPAVADISYPPDGIPEIIVTTGGDVDQCRGSIIAFKRDGTQ